MRYFQYENVVVLIESYLMILSYGRAAKGGNNYCPGLLASYAKNSNKVYCCKVEYLSNTCTLSDSSQTIHKHLQKVLRVKECKKKRMK